MSDRDPSAPGMTWLLFSPSGRIGRQVYALAFLFWVAITALCLAQLVSADAKEDQAGAALWFLALAFVAIMSAVSLLFLSIKRLHDVGLSGFFALSVFVPAVSFVAVLAMMLWPGNTEANRYGRLTNRPETA